MANYINLLIKQSIAYASKLVWSQLFSRLVIWKRNIGDKSISYLAMIQRVPEASLLKE